MKPNYRRVPFRSVLLFGVALATISFGVALLRNASKAAPDVKEATPSLSTSTGAPLTQIEAEVITILPSGFQPTQITRPAGKFLLAVENRSGLKSIDFRLDAQSGGRVIQVSRTWERADWSDVVNPPPGTYVLTEANHPTWQCVITITR
jgi:hypothetical protein